MEEVKFPRNISIEARTLLTGLLAKTPAERLGGGPDDVKEIQAHPFFACINWTDLVNKRITPPFKPQVSSDTDTRYFDSEFTGESVELTPPDASGPLGAIQEEPFPQVSDEIYFFHSHDIFKVYFNLSVQLSRFGFNAGHIFSYRC